MLLFVFMLLLFGRVLARVPKLVLVCCSWLLLLWLVLFVVVSCSCSLLWVMCYMCFVRALCPCSLFLFNVRNRCDRSCSAVMCYCSCACACVLFVLLSIVVVLRS